ncbi:unnamed protein product [Heligmosomoides polygyrus]|uniref:SCP domain-containing protein n=2 Tax=Heligmosomoides polygyrus TaxID=6339 RepID=A0A3P7YE01_HELPZ|nr:venom allergen/ancylostoma secreted protein-like 10 [Heligmosomoides bakeri]VDO86186.1 unnamed protein product [Heligmosomoides polygyrus]
MRFILAATVTLLVTEGLADRARRLAKRDVSGTEIQGNCPTDNGMDETIRKTLVDKHNECRSLVAQGKAENPLGANGYAPKAARMRKMVYDCNIEMNAMKHAQKCQFAHSPSDQRPGLGENIWALWTSGRYSLLDAAKSAPESWFSELKKAGMPEDNILTLAVWNRPQMIGHYTQMVWQNTYHLGCGVKHCPSNNMYFVVCQYGPTGNWLNTAVYDKGEPCATDADCKCSGCKCDREAALCIMPPSLPWTAQKGIQTA